MTERLDALPQLGRAAFSCMRRGHCEAPDLSPPRRPLTKCLPPRATPRHVPPIRPPQVRPYLMADGGNVELAEIDGLVVKLRLKGACGSCPSSLTTMSMGIKRKLVERIPVRRHASECNCLGSAS